MPCLSHLRDTSLLACLLLTADAVLPAQAPAITFTDTVYPGSGWPGEEKWLLGRIVDGRTGRPIPNAEVILLDESTHPMRGEFDCDPRGTADTDGFVHMRIDKRAPGYRAWSWIVVRAPGYGDWMSMHYFEDDVLRLAPAVTVPVQVLDWLERPVPDALVGFCKGCGHTPDLVHARTDQNGVARLPGVDLGAGIADFYLEHPELALGYESVDWVPGQPTARFDAPPGFPLTGVLVGQDGAPIVGAFVGVKDVHRGPWTRTGPGGSFRLYGSDSPDSDLWVHVGDREVLFEQPPQQPFRLQMPPPAGEGVTVVELTPQQRAQREAQQAAHEREQAAALADAPTVIVRVADLPADGSVAIRTRTSSTNIDDQIAAGTPVALPAEPFVFVLTGAEDNRRVIPYDRERARREGVVRLRWFRPTRVEGRVVDESGEPLAAHLSLVERDYVHDRDVDPKWPESEGAIAVDTEFADRTMLLAVRATNGRLPLRLIPVALPVRGDEAFVGTVVLRKQPQLVLLGRDGEPLDDGHVTLLRAGWHDFDRGNVYPIDDFGCAPLPDLQPGDALVVGDGMQPVTSADNSTIDLPARFVIAGDGPWRLQQPRGELRITAITTEDDRMVGITIGEHYVGLTEPTLLRGLQPGVHKVFLAAVGHRSAVAEVRVPATGCAELSVKLPPR